MADSPVKKLNFEAAGKENLPFDTETPVVTEVALTKPVVEEVQVAKVAPTIKPEEMDEPLLQENPNRFVLFPIKYHEVSFASSSRHA
jgi:ribonucleoside-diphosphate reductase subunit M2